MIIKCDENIEGMRLDRFLRKKLKDRSLSSIFESIRTGKVKINGKKQKENYRLKIDDYIEIKFITEEDIKEEKKKKNPKIETDKKKYMNMIFFEDENYLVINKPSGIAIHKGTSNKYGLAEIFKQIYNNENINFANRIDKETRGLVIGAKNLKSLRYLTEKIRNNKLIKKYIVVVSGEIEEDTFTIENYLEIKENRVEVSDEISGKLSKSVFKKLKTIKNRYTVLEVDLITGRKHQIRVQLENLGFPVLGDKKYNYKDNVNSDLMLIAYYLKFDNYEFQLDYSKYLENI